MLYVSYNENGLAFIISYWYFSDVSLGVMVNELAPQTSLV